MEAILNPNEYEVEYASVISEARNKLAQTPLDWNLSFGQVPEISKDYYDDLGRRVDLITNQNKNHRQNCRVELAALVLEEVGLLPTQQRITAAADQLIGIGDALKREELADEFLSLTALQQAVYNELHLAYFEQEAMGYTKKRTLDDDYRIDAPCLRLLEKMQRVNGKPAIGQSPAQELKAMFKIMYLGQNTTPKVTLVSVE